ncbi:hypothetical protein [Angustibacter sp. Root456]|uniref:hypothetical protein n=1 Tax=Angustibacter sp. Root456 TaxID=1736539 RepID=UPI0012FA7DBB|nr:hypothetical protein [Angustibacter sp. Root456]
MTTPDPAEHEARLARRRHRMLVLRRLDVVAQRRALARRRAEAEADGSAVQERPPRS